MSWVLNQLAVSYQAAGRHTDAAVCLTEALEIRRRLGDERGQASCLLNLGFVWIESGRAGEAVNLLDQALEIFQRLAVTAGEQVAHTNLGEAYRALGQYERALENHQATLAVREEGGDPLLDGRALTNLADILCLLGRHDEADEYAHRGRPLCAKARDRLDEGIAVDLLGQGCAARGDRAKARDYWLQAHAQLADSDQRRAADVHARLSELSRPPRDYGHCAARECAFP